MIAVLIAVLGVVAFIVLALCYGSLSWGFVVSKFYAWFVLTHFPTLPHFSILTFIGFAFFLSAILPKTTTAPIKKEYTEGNQTWITVLISPWVVLLCGWILTLFM